MGVRKPKQSEEERWEEARRGEGPYRIALNGKKLVFKTRKWRIENGDSVVPAKIGKWEYLRPEYEAELVVRRPELLALAGRIKRGTVLADVELAKVGYKAVRKRVGWLCAAIGTLNKGVLDPREAAQAERKARWEVMQEHRHSTVAGAENWMVWRARNAEKVYMGREKYPLMACYYELRQSEWAAGRDMPGNMADAMRRRWLEMGGMWDGKLLDFGMWTPVVVTQRADEPLGVDNFEIVAVLTETVEPSLLDLVGHNTGVPYDMPNLFVGRAHPEIRLIPRRDTDR